MLTTPEEVKKAQKEFKDDRRALYNRWDEDFDSYRLKPYKAGKGYYAYTSNSPRVLVDKIISIITQGVLLIRIEMEALGMEEQEIAGKVERFLYGCFNLNDERLILLDEPILREQMAWFTVVRGGYALRVFMNKDEEGETKPEIVCWDIRETAYEVGAQGLLWAIHTRKASKASILDEYGVTIGQKEAEVYDYWDKKNNGVVIQGTTDWAKPLEPHGLDYTPVFIFRTGTMPPVRSNSYTDTYAHRGESAFASNRGLYPILNKTMSDLLTLVRRGVKPPLGYYSHRGDKTIDSDIFGVEKAASLSLEVGEKIEPILPPSMPADARPLLDVVAGEQQRGGLPHTTYGQLGFRLSGFAISQLQGAIATVVSPFVETVERGYTIAAKELIRQNGQGFRPIQVRGRTSRGEVFGYPVSIKISPDELRQDWVPEVTLEPTLPQDDAQRYYLANLARQGDIPLLSDQTIREDLLKVKDPYLEDQKVLAEWGGNLELVRLKRIFDALVEQGRFADAEIVLMQMRMLLEGMTRGRQKAKQAPPTPFEQTAAEVPGGGAPAEETGLPSSVLPSEELGGVPGGMANAQMPLFGEL